MVKTLNNISQKLIEVCFYLLFFFVPLILTTVNYELFEYNKMMLAYGLTAIIIGAWLLKIIISKKLNIRRTPLDIPLLLFLASQIISTVLSIDHHVSVWGYYSRFNGSLLSTVSYILLYFTFVSNFPKEKIKSLLIISLTSGLLVSVYGILEHLGIDRDIWVQDVQNRVFSTLGQPNWLAAYLAVLTPITLAFTAGKIGRTRKLLIYGAIGIIFYAVLIFTKSRSGFLGFWISFALLVVYLAWRYQKAILNFLIFTIVSLSIVTFLFGAPFDQIDKFTLPELISKQSNNQTIAQSIKPVGSSVIDVGITESGTIRKIVWSGAVDIFRHYPLFGTGVETFAFAYYKFRPAAHNMTSEWDFLYNKAHNEYLNYAATTGAFGLGSYLLIIIVFIGWNLLKLKVQSSNIKSSSKFKAQNKLDFACLPARQGFDLNLWILTFGLFSGWLSILITNFFGFSVVIIQLFFFLIPAMVFVLTNESDNSQQPKANKDIGIVQYTFCLIVILLNVYILYFLARLWYADMFFADGYRKTRAQETTTAYQSLKRALEINDSEPLYYDEFSFPAAQIAVAFADEKQATLSAALTKEAVIATNFAVASAPQNVNFWKTRTRVFYTLAQLDEKYLGDALYALQQAEILSPTDPKVKYNLGLLYDRMDKKPEGVAKLEEATKLKPDYRDAFFALAYLYEKDNKRDKAREALKYILTKIATDDAEAKKKLEDLK